MQVWRKKGEITKGIESDPTPKDKDKQRVRNADNDRSVRSKSRTKSFDDEHEGNGSTTLTVIQKKETKDRKYHSYDYDYEGDGYRYHKKGYDWYCGDYGDGNEYQYDYHYSHGHGHSHHYDYGYDYEYEYDYCDGGELEELGDGVDDYEKRCQRRDQMERRNARYRARNGMRRSRHKRNGYSDRRRKDLPPRFRRNRNKQRFREDLEEFMRELEVTIIDWLKSKQYPEDLLPIFEKHNIQYISDFGKMRDEDIVNMMDSLPLTDTLHKSTREVMTYEVLQLAIKFDHFEEPETNEGNESPSESKDSKDSKSTEPPKDPQSGNTVGKTAQITEQIILADGVRCYQYWGATVFIQQGEELWIQEATHSERDPSVFTYTQDQRTLICCECDFSFTVSMINKRGGARNLCSTTLYQYVDQWNGRIQSEVGSESFVRFRENLTLCQIAGCKVTFGVDATNLRVKETEFNDESGRKFDRIACTFPRIFSPKWEKEDYKRNNHRLINGLFESYKQHLVENGEIHVLLFEGQFFHWKIRNILKRLDLELAYWCKLDAKGLGQMFKGYGPKDIWGNDINLTKWTMYLCSFRVKREEEEIENGDDDDDDTESALSDCESVVTVNAETISDEINDEMNGVDDVDSVVSVTSNCTPITVTKGDDDMSDDEKVTDHVDVSDDDTGSPLSDEVSIASTTEETAHDVMDDDEKVEDDYVDINDDAMNIANSQLSDDGSLYSMQMRTMVDETNVEQNEDGVHNLKSTVSEFRSISPDDVMNDDKPKAEDSDDDDDARSLSRLSQISEDDSANSVTQDQNEDIERVEEDVIESDAAGSVLYDEEVESQLSDASIPSMKEAIMDDENDNGNDASDGNGNCENEAETETSDDDVIGTLKEETETINDDIDEKRDEKVIEALQDDGEMDEYGDGDEHSESVNEDFKTADIVEFEEFFDAVDAVRVEKSESLSIVHETTDVIDDEQSQQIKMEYDNIAAVTAAAEENHKQCDGVYSEPVVEHDEEQRRKKKKVRRKRKSKKSEDKLFAVMRDVDALLREKEMEMRQDTLRKHRMEKKRQFKSKKSAAKRGKGKIKKMKKNRGGCSFDIDF